ncbi:MAG: sensor domain-containing diguanylate cyclase [Deltaproteobacteria bacterium]|nr:sensor domain-containing diguanylate cyclase [Deltaproteobacteria bacterium]
MVFDLAQLSGFISDFVLALRHDRIEYISPALARRMGFDDQVNLSNPDSLSIHRDMQEITLSSAQDNHLKCSFIGTKLDDLLLFSLNGEEVDTHSTSDKIDTDIFAKIVKNHDAGCVILSRGLIIFANHKFSEIVGYRLDELAEKQFLGLISTRSRPEYIKWYHSVCGNQPDILPIKKLLFSIRDGRHIYASVSGGCTDDHNGGRLVWLFINDVTEQQRLETRHKDLKNRFRELFDRSPTGILYISRKGVVLDCNEFVSIHTGYSKDEIIGCDFSKFVASHEVQSLRDDFKKLYIEGTILKRECQLTTKQGTNIDIDFTAWNIARKRRKAGALMLFTDITHKKVLEKELLAKNADSEKTLWEMAEVKDALEARASELTIATQELQILNEKLNQRSITDGLTDIYNHRYFQERLTEEVERVRRMTDGYVSLLMLDIDDFKKINDTWGHQGGDVVLKQVAMVLKGKMRNIDIVARYGGDEFAVILPNTDAKNSCLVGQRICESVNTTPFKIDENKVVNITVSIGAAMVNSTNSREADLIKMADTALYTAKASGKGRFELWQKD